MAKFIRRRETPVKAGWFTAAALATALAAHGVLYGLIRYQPFMHPVSVRSRAVVSLLPVEGSLQNWLAVHDPATATRSGSASGYAGYYRTPEARRNVGRGPLYPVKPNPREPQRFRPFETAMPMVPELLSSHILRVAPLPPPSASAPAGPRATDETGRRLPLELTLPEGKGALRPTVIRFNRSGGVIRQTLLDSCGEPELDRLARAAAARSGIGAEGETIVTVEWPFPAAAAKEVR